MVRAMRDEMATPAPAAADFFGGSSPSVACAACVILVLAIAVIDQLTGYDLHLGVLYLVPITMVTWSAGGRWGLAIGLVATAVWITIFRGEHHSPNSFYFYWDAVVQFAIFAIVIFLIA